MDGLGPGATERMRPCRVCGEEGTTWVLLAITWPQGSRKGETMGISLCDEHIELFRETLAIFNAEDV